LARCCESPRQPPHPLMKFGKVRAWPEFDVSVGLVTNRYVLNHSAIECGLLFPRGCLLQLRRTRRRESIQM
jgi:hypothetical protein